MVQNIQFSIVKVNFIICRQRTFSLNKTTRRLYVKLLVIQKRPQRESNPQPPDSKSVTLSIEL